MNKLTKKRLLIISIGLLIINLFLAFALFNLDNSTYENLDGSKVKPYSSELIQGIIVGLVISFPLLSLFIGLIVAIFIDRGVPYSKRIVKGSLLTLSTIYGLFAVMGAIKVMMLL